MNRMDAGFLRDRAKRRRFMKMLLENLARSREPSWFRIACCGWPRQQRTQNLRRETLHRNRRCRIRAPQLFEQPQAESCDIASVELRRLVEHAAHLAHAMQPHGAKLDVE